MPDLVQKGEEVHRIAWGGVHCYNTAFSPDGRPSLEVNTGKLLHGLSGHTHWAQHSVFHPDGKRALSSGMNGKFRLWVLTAGKEVRKFTGHAGCIPVVARPSGCWLYP